MDKSLRDVYLRHGINLTRYSNYEAQRLIKILDASNSQIQGIIRKAKAIETKEKYYRVAAEIRRVTRECHEQLDGQVELDFMELAAEETRFVEKALRGANVKSDFELPAPKKIWAAAGFGSYSEQGHETFETYLNGLSENLYKTWDMQVRAGYLTGMTAKQINRAVLGSTDGIDTGQMQALRRSLESNTKTMVAHLAETARDAVYRENSSLFSGYRYLGTLDTRTCMVCGELDGKIFKEIEDVPKLPQHLNCVLGDTLVSTASGISNVFRRPYKGKIIVITTASGNVLRITPNHPVLCNAGFIPAKFIKEGDNLVINNGLKALHIGNKGKNNKVSRIEDVFSSLREADNMISMTVPASSEDFHGDVSDKEVEVISPTGKFSLKKNPFIIKIFRKGCFIFGNLNNSIGIPCISALGSFFKRSFTTFSRDMGVMHPFCNGFFRGVFHSFKLLLFSVPLFNSILIKKVSHIHSGISQPSSDTSNANSLIVKLKDFFKIRRFDVASWRSINSSILKDAPNSFMIDIKTSRYIFDRYKRFIKLDNVLSVSIIENFSGHIYNLQTKNNWYVANNIIIHNCRCLLVPVVKGMEEHDEDDTRASMDGPVSANMSYSDWLKTQPDEIVRDILGPTRFAMYKSGAEVSQFVADGRTLTLSQLRKLEGIPEVLNSKRFAEQFNDFIHGMKERIGETKFTELPKDVQNNLQQTLYTHDIKMDAEQFFSNIDKIIANGLLIRHQDIGGLIRNIEAFDKDPRIKTQFETGTSEGSKDIAARNMWETNIARLGSKNPLTIEESGPAINPFNEIIGGIQNRPTYGEIIPRGLSAYGGAKEYGEKILGGAKRYGELHMVLSDNVRDRTTYTSGDSSGNFGSFTSSSVSSFTRTQSQYRDIQNFIDLYNTANGQSPKGYTEAQYWGGIDLSRGDVKEVVIEKYYYDKFMYREKDKFTLVLNIFSRYNIPIRIVETE